MINNVLRCGFKRLGGIVGIIMACNWLLHSLLFTAVISCLLSVASPLHAIRIRFLASFLVITRFIGSRFVKLKIQCNSIVRYLNCMKIRNQALRESFSLLLSESHKLFCSILCIAYSRFHDCSR